MKFQLILKIQKIISIKELSKINDSIKSNSEENNAKFIKYSTLITELIEIVSNRKHDYQKKEELSQMKNSIWPQINDNKNKLIKITKDLENEIFKYDRIIRIIQNFLVKSEIDANLKA